MVGQVLLHYRIMEKIGEGGMGVVYKALDAHLDRPVAVKVLPADRVADAERKRRFVQEAKAASALNHPNIVTVYDITSDQGLDFIVMEFVEGQTLDRLIGRRGMKLNEALGLAVQVADGLTRAHAAGIVHRDLKPTNVIVTPDGRVKILDFGLAKLVENAEPEAAGPTMTMKEAEKPRTEEGFVIGTAAYMSPEQAEGKKVDARSDIFSFGAVLYEMLTGQKAFSRESRISTLAAVLREEPKAAGQLNDSLPPEVEQVLSRCLRKDPARRWQTMSDLRVVLQDLKEDSESGKLRAVSVAARPHRRRLLWVAAAAIFLVAAGAVLLKIFLSRPQGPVEYVTTRLTYDSGFTGMPAISPKGDLVAYASDRGAEGNVDIWVQQPSGGKALRLTDDPADDTYPSFSPDGSSIVFRSERNGGGIYMIGTLGGDARRIADKGIRPKFSPDGSRIVFIEYPASLETRLVKMYLVSPQGGEPRAFQPEFCILSWATGCAPVWSPDGKYLLFYGRRIDDPSSADWWVAPTDGGPPVRTGATKNLAFPQGPVIYPVDWAGGHVYFISGSTIEGINIFRTPIESGSWTIAGPVEPLTSGPGMKQYASVTSDGDILFSNMAGIMGPWTLAARPDEGSVLGEAHKLTEDLMPGLDLSISLDGSKIAYNSYSSLQEWQVYIRLMDMKSGRETAIPVQGSSLFHMPRISPDGSVLVYQDTVSGKTRTFLLSSGSTIGREICQSCAVWSLYADLNYALQGGKRNELWRMNIKTGDKIPVLVVESGFVSDAGLSTDDRWIGYIVGKPDGRVALYVAPLGTSPVSEKESILIIESDRYLGSPKWSPNGRFLYYLSERDGRCGLYAQRLDPASKKPVGEAVFVYRPRQARYHLNFPPGLGTIGVAKDKIVMSLGDVTGNIYLAKPKTR
jgi:Tol biopolymer transport system component/predicted Ser/Thr protein kinase